MPNPTLIRPTPPAHGQHPAPPPDGATVDARVVVVTPDLAARWYERNTHNRDVSDRHVEALAREILADQWYVSGDAIKWEGDPDNGTAVLLDGQKRLLAVMLANKPITTLVVTGVNRDAQRVMDTQQRRSAADMLKLEGWDGKLARAIAAAASMAMLWEAGLYGATDYNGPRTPTHTEILAWVREHPEIEVAARIGAKYRVRKLDAAARSVAAYLLLQVASEEQVEGFFESLTTWVGFTAKDPRSALLRRLDTVADQKTRLPRWVMANLIIRTWNYMMKGEDIDRFPLWTGGNRWFNPEKPLPPVVREPYDG